MHPAIENAKEEIDAAMFSGDSFIDRENIAWLRRYMERWEKALKSHEEILDEIEREDKPRQLVKGNVVNNLNMNRKLVVTFEREMSLNEEFVCDTPHEDGDYSYMCSNQHCRCSQ